MERAVSKGFPVLALLLILSLPSIIKAQVEPKITNRERPTNVQRPVINQDQLSNAFTRAREEITRRRDIEASVSGRTLNIGVHGAEARHQVQLSPYAKSRNLAQIQERFEEATLGIVQQMNLTHDQIIWELPDAQLTGRQAENEIGDCEAEFEERCERRGKYRSADGSCNNVRNPTWGRSFTCFRRLLPAAYANSVNTPRVSRSRRPLPNAREVSVQIHSFINRPAQQFTHMFMIFGQFLDHDITLTPLTRTADNRLIQCCPDNDNPQCMPILLQNNDPFYGQFGVRCMNFVRSTLCPTCTLGIRQQTNQVTTFIDSSTLYGSSLNESQSLRTNSGDGKLIMVRDNQAGDLLPPSTNPNNDQCSIPAENKVCYRAGDNRVNQHPGIASTHTIWTRQHNRIAEGLRQRNRRWSDEKLFQETRRIIIAQMQMITYGEYLPVTLGREFMRIFNLRVKSNGYTSYDPTTNPTLMNEFSTAAYRFGHSLINTGFDQVSRNGRKQNPAELRDYFFFPFEINTGQLDPLLRGSIQQPAQSFDQSLVPDVSNFCYRRRGNQTGLDLASLNIQRGRDHGIPGYTEYLYHCFSHNVRSFSDLQFIEPRLIRRLQALYESVTDIDLFTGGISETALNGAALGPTFGCIVGLQFNHLKYGDRFYFEHGGQEASFTSDQLSELRKTKYAKIMCETSNVKEIQLNVFRFPNNRNRARSCSEIPDIDLSAWDGE